MGVVTRRLVVTADDFGLSPSVNRGVALAHRAGIVTAASLMVHRDHAQEAAALARELPALSVGLHLDLADYDVVDDEWVTRLQRVDLCDAAAVRREVVAQVERFVGLLGRPPSHLDSHHHLHLDEPALDVVLDVASGLGVPVRGRGPWAYRGDFYGQYGRAQPWPQGITVDALRVLLASLGPGTTELACHPADGLDPAHGPYDAERTAELAALCDGEVLAAIERFGIELVGPGATQPKRPDT